MIVPRETGVAQVQRNAQSRLLLAKAAQKTLHACQANAIQPRRNVMLVVALLLALLLPLVRPAITSHSLS
jgi:hypothetical protein